MPFGRWLCCAAPRNAERPVSGDGGARTAHVPWSSAISADDADLVSAPGAQPAAYGGRFLGALGTAASGSMPSAASKGSSASATVFMVQPSPAVAGDKLKCQLVAVASSRSRGSALSSSPEGRASGSATGGGGSYASGQHQQHVHLHNHFHLPVTTASADGGGGGASSSAGNSSVAPQPTFGRGQSLNGGATHSTQAYPSRPGSGISHQAVQNQPLPLHPPYRNSYAGGPSATPTVSTTSHRVRGVSAELANMTDGHTAGGGASYPAAASLPASLESQHRTLRVLNVKYAGGGDGVAGGRSRRGLGVNGGSLDGGCGDGGRIGMGGGNVVGVRALSQLVEVDPPRAETSSDSQDVSPDDVFVGSTGEARERTSHQLRRQAAASATAAAAATSGRFPLAAERLLRAVSVAPGAGNGGGGGGVQEGGGDGGSVQPAQDGWPDQAVMHQQQRHQHQHQQQQRQSVLQTAAPQRLRVAMDVLPQGVSGGEGGGAVPAPGAQPQSLKSAGGTLILPPFPFAAVAAVAAASAAVAGGADTAEQEQAAVAAAAGAAAPAAAAASAVAPQAPPPPPPPAYAPKQQQRPLLTLRNAVANLAGPSTLAGVAQGPALADPSIGADGTSNLVRAMQITRKLSQPVASLSASRPGSANGGVGAHVGGNGGVGVGVGVGVGGAVVPYGTPRAGGGMSVFTTNMAVANAAAGGQTAAAAQQHLAYGSGGGGEGIIALSGPAGLSLPVYTSRAARLPYQASRHLSQVAFMHMLDGGSHGNGGGGGGGGSHGVATGPNGGAACGAGSPGGVDSGTSPSLHPVYPNPHHLATLNMGALSREIVALRWIGQGGGGAVFQGVWQGAPVAVKFLLAEADSPAALDAAALEGVVSSVVNHPNVVHTYAFECTRLTEASFAAEAELEKQGSSQWENGTRDLLGSLLDTNALYGTMYGNGGGGSGSANLNSNPNIRRGTTGTLASLNGAGGVGPSRLGGGGGGNAGGGGNGLGRQGVSGKFTAADNDAGGIIAEEAEDLTEEATGETTGDTRSATDVSTALAATAGEAAAAGGDDAEEAGRREEEAAAAAAAAELAVRWSGHPDLVLSEPGLNGAAGGGGGGGGGAAVAVGAYGGGAGGGGGGGGGGGAQSLARNASMARARMALESTFQSDEGFGDPDITSGKRGWNVRQVLSYLKARSGMYMTHIIMEYCDRGSLLAAIKRGIFKLEDDVPDGGSSHDAAAAIPGVAAAVAAAGAVPCGTPGARNEAVAGAAAGGGGGGGGPLAGAAGPTSPPHAPQPSSSASRFPRRIVLRAVLRTARDVAQGMSHLHANGIIHGDLKPGNVLLRGCRSDRRGFVAMVADFGLSKVTRGDKPLEAHHWSTVTVMAPEVILGRWLKASDVFSFGILLWQLVTSEPVPYGKLTVPQILLGVSQGTLTPEWPCSAHPALVRLGRACLATSPEKRPSFEAIVKVLTKIEKHVREELRLQRQAESMYGSTQAIASTTYATPSTPDAAAARYQQQQQQLNINAGRGGGGPPVAAVGAWGAQRSRASA